MCKPKYQLDLLDLGLLLDWDGIGSIRGLELRLGLGRKASFDNFFSSP